MTDRELPTLRIVKTNSLILHEECEASRIRRLRDIVAADRYLKNPPVVAPLPSQEEELYVVLDGANRVTALQQLAYPHVIVQVVHYDEVGLDTWNHLVTGMDKDEFFSTLKSISGLVIRPSDLLSARDLLAARRILAYIVCHDEDVHTLSGGGASLQAQAGLLNHVVDCYKESARIYRLKTDDISQQVEFYDDVAALVVFPAFTPADIVDLATNHAKLPTGVTRHIIPGRALRVNVPLSVLRADQSLDSKNAWLHDSIKAKLNRKEVRFYQESTFLFDE